MRRRQRRAVRAAVRRDAATALAWWVGRGQPTPTPEQVHVHHLTHDCLPACRVLSLPRREGSCNGPPHRSALATRQTTASLPYRLPNRLPHLHAVVQVVGLRAQHLEPVRTHVDDRHPVHGAAVADAGVEGVGREARGGAALGRRLLTAAEPAGQEVWDHSVSRHKGVVVQTGAMGGGGAAHSQGRGVGREGMALGRLAAPHRGYQLA